MVNAMTGIELLSVPYDSGRRGERMGAGPQALLRAGLVQTLRRSGREVELVPIEGAATSDAVTSAFDLCGRIARVVRAASAGSRFPVVLSGNCMSTVGALAGLGEARPGVLWLDAHGDLNTPETSTSGFLDGMAAATCLGWCHEAHTGALEGFTPLAESSLVLAGARDLDAPEQDAIDRSGVRRLTVEALRAADGAAVAAALDGVSSLYIHLDLDVLDPAAVGRANSYASADGLTADQVVDVIRHAAAHTRVIGLTVSAYDPAQDADGKVAAAAIAAIAATVHAALDA